MVARGAAAGDWRHGGLGGVGTLVCADAAGSGGFCWRRGGRALCWAGWSAVLGVGGGGGGLGPHVFFTGAVGSHCGWLTLSFYNFTFKKGVIYLCRWNVNFEVLFWMRDVD